MLPGMVADVKKMVSELEFSINFIFVINSFNTCILSLVMCANV